MLARSAAALLLLSACKSVPGAGAGPDAGAAPGAQSLELVDLYGRRVAPLASGRPVVVLFTSTDCPISNRYATEVGRLVASYGSEADFWVVYPGPDQPVGEVRRHAEDHGYRARIARDPGHRLVELAEARVTPEAAVFSSTGELIYSGRIDDRWVDFGRSRPEPTVHDLERVLLAVLAGDYLGDDPIRTSAVGCPIPDLP